MAIDAIGVVQSNSVDLSRNSGISQDDFLRLLLAQLRFQDPLKPVDNQQFIAQLAQFSALEINRQQSEKVDTLLTVESITQSVGLIGRSVQLRTAQGDSPLGIVSAVSFSGGEPRLMVDVGGGSISDVRPSDVVRVVNPTPR
jgi:flagellar basal-body rod modification protein FlgD